MLFGNRNEVVPVATVPKTSSTNMIGAPTVVPAVGVNGQGLPTIETDPYFAIEVDTTNRDVATRIVLFDGSRGYQFSHNYQMPIDVGIRGLTADYQFIVNDMVHNSSYFDIMKMRVIGDEQVSLVQFAHVIKVYDSSKGSESRLLKSIYPDMGIHEGQFQLNINTFSSPTLLTNRTALVYTQEPGIKLVLGFYQKAEIGRKQ